MVIKMKTIAIIESCDTKFKKAKFISDFIRNENLNMELVGKKWKEKQKEKRSIL